MMNPKKLLIGCGCALLAIALVVCLVLVIGNGAEDKPTLPSNGTPVTNPDGTTNPTDSTTPSGNTDPTGPDATTDPTTPSSGVTEPTTEPTIGTHPTEPSTGEDVIPTNPGTEPENPDLSGEYDFGHITPGTITINDWNAWDARKRQAFLDWTDNVWDTLTAQERHNNMVVIWYGGYNCHFEGHACKDAVSHNRLLAEMEAGCLYCKKNDCPSFSALDENLFTKIDVTKCPEYGVEKDPSEYCQTCGLPISGKSGDVVCHKSMSGLPCDFCGAERGAKECHKCTKP